KFDEPGAQPWRWIERGGPHGLDPDYSTASATALTRPSPSVVSVALRWSDRDMSAQDPITEELFRNSLAALGDEMVLTIYRTAYSGVLKNIMDYSAALCD